MRPAREKGEETITLGYLPKSFNATARVHWAVVRRHKIGLQQDLELMLYQLPRPLQPPVLATATLIVPNRIRRDEGNFRTPLEKALGDALTNGGWLTDDTPDLFRFGALDFEYRKGESETRVHLRWGKW